MIYNDYDKDTYVKYNSHKIFKSLVDIKDFYKYLAINDDSCSLMVVKNIYNTNYDIFVSISNTIDSILVLLKKGRINDSMALLRKYNDAVIVHTYSMLQIENEKDNFWKEDFRIYDNIVNKWVYEKEQLIKKEKNILSEIKSVDKKLEEFLFSNKETYKKGRTIGDDNVHYNSFDMFAINNERIKNNTYSIEYLDDACEVLLFIFIIHFSYIVRINPLTMVSSDYVCMLDAGLKPEEGSQNHAAGFVVDMYLKYIKSYNIDLANYLNDCTFLKLEY